MPVNLTSAVAAAGGYSGYQIDNSMLLDDGSSQTLSWTPGSTGNQTAWTINFLVKRCALGSRQAMLGTSYISISEMYLRFDDSDRLEWQMYSSGGATLILNLVTSKVFRDVGAFYMITLVYDSANGTSTDRARIYVNGERMTAFDTTHYPTASELSVWNQSSHTHYFGAYRGSAQYFNGYISALRFLDGTAVTDDTTFGEFWSGNDKAWRAIEPSGLTYGSNGFYLNFSNGADLGEDQAGSNDWTANGSPVQSSDSPTVNYATLNVLDQTTTGSIGTYSNGNRTVATSVNDSLVATTIPVIEDGSYWEVVVDSAGDEMFGLWVSSTTPLRSASTSSPHTDAASCVIRVATNTVYNEGSGSSFTPATISNTDVLMFAYKNGQLFYGKNNTWENSGDPVAETGELFTISNSPDKFIFPVIGRSGAGNVTYKMQIADDELTYTPPTGYVALSATNLPEATITDPGEHFNAVLHTGTGAENAITGVGFQPDFTWFKNRDSTDSHMLFDAIRGATGVLHSDSSAAETTEAQTLKSFDSDGFTLGTDVQVNTNTENYVSWNWKADGAGVANSDGSISSTVSVNDDAGCSIVSWTATGTGSDTIGHGQSSAPELIIKRERDAADSWFVQCIHYTSGAYSQFLEGTQAQTSSSAYWNSTFPTDTVFSQGTVMNSTNDCIAYCFRSIPGYSKVFQYTGNGSTDGPFVWLGFKPRFVLIKVSSSTGSWQIQDSERDPYNLVGATLWADLSSQETVYTGTSYTMDYVAGGLKLRSSNAWTNASSATYIGIAFAEVPFGLSNGPIALAA